MDGIYYGYTVLAIRTIFNSNARDYENKVPTTKAVSKSISVTKL